MPTVEDYGGAGLVIVLFNEYNQNPTYIFANMDVTNPRQFFAKTLDASELHMGHQYYAYCIGSIISLRRQYITCSEVKPLAFMPQLLECTVPASFLEQEQTTVARSESKDELQLNPSQQQVVQKVMTMSNGILPVLGPPGTGKTRTIRKAINRLVCEKKTEPHILVCAPSNKAVAVLAGAYIKAYGPRDICIAGVASKLSAELQDYITHNIVADISDFCLQMPQMLLDQEKWSHSLATIVTADKLRQYFNTKLEGLQKWKEALLIRQQCYSMMHTRELEINLNAISLVTTVFCDRYKRYAAGREDTFYDSDECEQLCDWYFKKVTILYVKLQRLMQGPNLEADIIDSARVVFMTLDVSKRGVMEHLKKKFTHLFVDEAGQATQPATLNAMQALALENAVAVLVGDFRQLPATLHSRAAKGAGFGISLLQLVGEDNALMLNEQYRMHKQIAEFSKEYCYGGDLTTAASVRARENPLARCHSAITPLMIVDVRGAESRVQTSYNNQAEVDLIINMVRSLIHSGIQTSQISIISFYRAQITLLKQKLQAFDLNDITVSTVDGFQGCENGIVFVSAVCSNELRFTDDDQRVNVAMTRAKYFQCLVGNKSVLQQSQGYLGEFVRYAEERSLIRTQAEVMTMFPVPAVVDTYSAAPSTRALSFAKS